ncbi:hypothetical protein [Sphingobacterium wenxiniae]|uniref:hypothetical protein n=1 Tax=Sphingobacterium wenxiniae TaxID=683125 RepID=UPI00147C93B4|nr:hypothetical protein [Sphingobacterium wenxiniae]
MRDKCGDVGRIKSFDHVERYSLHYLSGQSFLATSFDPLLRSKVGKARPASEDKIA